jgi:hypothetical protein
MFELNPRGGTRVRSLAGRVRRSGRGGRQPPMRRLSVTIPLLLLAMAGCSANPVPASDTSVMPVPEVTQGSTTPRAEPTQTAEPVDATEYFTALASNDEDTMEGAQDLAAPKSLAAAYALHLTTTAAAELDGGSVREPDVLNVNGNDYEDCPVTEDKCTTWSDVKFSGGKVSSFTVNGVDISKRISVGSGDWVRAGNLGQVRFISSYQSVASKALFVTFEFKSGNEKVTLNLGGATYRDPSGRQADATGYAGPDDLDADSSARGFSTFQGAKPGGTVTLNLYDDDFNDHFVKIKTR